MITTPNLGLKLTEEADDPLFADWQKRIDGSGMEADKSNFKKIDDFAGEIYGRSGRLSIAQTDWKNSSYTVAVAELGANDALFLTPATREDQDKSAVARLFATASVGSVTITAESVPTGTITFNYFISRGKT